MRSLIRWFLLITLLAGAVAGAAWPAYQWWQNRSIPRYVTARVTRGRVESVVNSTGTVKPVRSVSVGAFVSGPIKEVYVDFNDRVEKDQVIALIDPRLLEAAVKRDKALLATQVAEAARSEALLEQAKNNEARARRLMAINKDFLSETEMDQYHFTRKSLEAQLEVAEAAIRQARANLENSEANLGYTKVKSPVTGIVIERKVDPGQTVAASFQTPEMFVVAPDMDREMHVYASVDEADIGLIRTAQKLGKKVNFTVDAYPQEDFTGRIYQVRNSSTTTQNVVTYPVVIVAKNTEMKLMPGMTASISFLIEAKDEVLRVPSAALRYVPPLARAHPDDRHYLEGLLTDPSESGVKLSASQKAAAAKGRSRRLVWVEDGPWLRAIPVTLGLMDNQYAEVIEGELKEGQALVTGTDLSVPGGRP